MSAVIKASEIEGDEKKGVLAASLPDMPVEMPLFVRERCRYVGRDATLSKCPVNPRNKPSK
jgi:hypothetical protein